MAEHHELMGGKLHVYKRDNSGLWQCSTYLAGKNHRVAPRTSAAQLSASLGQTPIAFRAP